MREGRTIRNHRDVLSKIYSIKSVTSETKILGWTSFNSSIILPNSHGLLDAVHHFRLEDSKLNFSHETAF